MKRFLLGTTLGTAFGAASLIAALCLTKKVKVKDVKFGKLEVVKIVNGCKKLIN